MKLNIPTRVASAAILCFGLAGCTILEPTADLTEFYVLRPQAATVPADPVGASEIRVGPGQLADYLENSRIVVQRGVNGIDYLDLHQWAEPPSKGVSRVLAENLAASLKGVRLVRYPDTALAATGYEVRYQVGRFEGKLGGAVVLEVSWQLIQQPAGDVIVEKHSTYTVAVQDGAEDVAAYVAGLSTALGEWSEEVAASMAAP